MNPWIIGAIAVGVVIIVVIGLFVIAASEYVDGRDDWDV